MKENGRYAIYKGKEYDLNGDMEGNTLIFTNDKSLIDETFTDRLNSGVYSKIITEDELEEIYSIHTFGYVKGLKVNVDHEFDTTYRVYTMNTEISQALGLPQIGKFEYEGEIPKEDIEIFEERKVIKEKSID